MELNRRRYLATLGTTASALALAGCSESDSGDSGGGDAKDNSGDSSNGNSDNSGGDGNGGGDNNGGDSPYTETAPPGARDGNGGGDNNGGDSGGNDQPDVEILSHEFYEEEFSSGVRGTDGTTRIANPPPSRRPRRSSMPTAPKSVKDSTT